MGRTGNKKKPLLIAVSCVIVLVMLWIGISLGLYGMYFNRKIVNHSSSMLQVSQFDGLKRTRYEFLSDRGQTITGYMYEAGKDQKGIIVFSHGYGAGGHNSYMSGINYFAKNGYYVFAFDVTGNDESAGEVIGGVPQAVIDLNYAISFVEDSGNFQKLPIYLFGHSWGGYSVCNVLKYHPEVKAVIECSGPCSSSAFLESGGRNVVGPLIYVVLPVVKTYERIRFGDYATNTGIDGLSATDAKVMVVHGAKDTTIYIEYGYDIYYEHFKDDPRFTFVRLENEGHNSFIDADKNPEIYKSFVEFYNSL